MKTRILAFVFTLQILWGYSQSSYKPDLSVDVATFKTEALKPKQEVWVVDFWASWCKPCIQAIPHLMEIQTSMAGKNVRFFSVSWDDSEEKWLRALDYVQMPWQQLLGSKTDKQFWDKHFPHKYIPYAFVIGVDGKVKKVSDVENLEAAILKALQRSKR